MSLNQNLMGMSNNMMPMSSNFSCEMTQMHFARKKKKSESKVCHTDSEK